MRTITGVATSITAFLGRAVWGPVDEPTAIHSYGRPTGELATIPPHATNHQSRRPLPDRRGEEPSRRSRRVPSSIRRGAAVAAALVLCLAAGAVNGQAMDEVRGVWLNPDAFNSPSARSSTLGKIASANLNTVFLAAPPINGNYGWSDPAAFQICLDDARLQGLAVHGWIANHSRLGGSPVDFSSAAERASQRQWVLDLLAAYRDLDGVHFDYIRDEHWDDPDAARMGGITELLRISKEAIDSAFAGKRLTATSFTSASASYLGSQPDWSGDVPQWYRDWYDADPGNWYIQQGATDPSLDPDWLLGPLHFNYQQNSPFWLSSAYADAVVPMQYTNRDSASGSWRRRGCICSPLPF